MRDGRRNDEGTEESIVEPSLTLHSIPKKCIVGNGKEIKVSG